MRKLTLDVAYQKYILLMIIQFKIKLFSKISFESTCWKYTLLIVIKYSEYFFSFHTFKNSRLREND